MARWLELAEELSLPVSELERLGGSGIMWFFELVVHWSARRDESIHTQVKQTVCTAFLK